MLLNVRLHRCTTYLETAYSYRPSTLCLKKHPTCYNFDTCEQILTFFGRTVTDKVCGQKML